MVRNGEAIAHVTTIPIRLWYGGTERPAYWIKGLWVLPEAQRSSAGFLVLRAAVTALRYPTLALVHEPAAIRLFQALGYTELGGLPNRLRVLRPAALLARLEVVAALAGRSGNAWRLSSRLARVTAPVLGPIVGAGHAIWVALRTASFRGLATLLRATVDDHEVDSLWRATREHLGPAVVRDGLAIARRYSSGEYAFVEVRDRGRLVGLGVVKRPNSRGDARLGGLRISTLADVLYRPGEEDVARLLLRGAERAAKAFDADALLVSTSPVVMGPVTRQLGYATVPANLHVLAKIPDVMSETPNDFGDWWISRGDSEGDGSL